jgi:hypothetical protein
VAPTCSAKGYTNYVCNYNNNHTKKDNYTDENPNNHAWVKNATVAPTCSAKGYVEYICSYNNNQTKQDNYTDLVPHDYTIKGDTISNATC